MTDFLTSFNYTMDSEDASRSGIVTSEPLGGKARFGLNSIAHPELPKEFWTMPAADALVIAEKEYRVWYWNPCNLDACVEQHLANKIFDDAFWMGVGRAGRWAQMALNTVIEDVLLTVDGVLGPKSWEALNCVESLSLRTAMVDLVVAQVRESAANNPAIAIIKDSLLARAKKLG
jgi:hypothetical protein